MMTDIVNPIVLTGFMLLRLVVPLGVVLIAGLVVQRFEPEYD